MARAQELRQGQGDHLTIVIMRKTDSAQGESAVPILPALILCVFPQAAVLEELLQM